MNHIYRLVWNKARRQWVVTHEGSRARGKSREGRKSSRSASGLAAAMLLAQACGASLALAAPPAPTTLPQGGVVAAGSVHIGAPTANQLQVTQTSEQAVINWSSFDIGAQAKVNFVQPDAAASVLNRVLASDPTQILGQLSANGKVFIVNPNGIVFGAGSRVDAGALVASTLNIADGDFMRGQMRFSRDGATGSIVNAGSLNAAPGGYVALIGATVSNHGSIRAPGGSAILAAGDTVQLPVSASGLVTLALSPASVNAAVTNGADGIVSAPGGQIYLSAAAASGLAAQALNQGQIVARDGGSVTMSAIQAEGLGETRQQGLVDVASDTGKGGSVALLGDRVALLAGSQVLADGATGGGNVKVGGDSQGQGDTFQASAVYVDPQARIDASATGQGDGGNVVLWSRDYTGFYGQITARGGAQGGSGGLVETSSHSNLQAFGSVDAAASQGIAGRWLLDPTDVTIVTGAVNSNDTDAGGIWTPTTNSAQIGVSNINADLNAGTSVTINTTSAGAGIGDITQNAGANIAKTAGGNATLTLNAAGSISLNGNISSTVGTLATTLNANGGAVSGTGTINTNGGLLTVKATSGTGTMSGGISGTGGLTKSGAGTLQLTGAGFNYTGATSLNVGGGQLLLNATTAYASPTTVRSGTKLSFTSNANLTIPAAATIALQGGTLENLNPTHFTVLNGAVTNSSALSVINQSSNATAVSGEGFYLDGGLKGNGTVTINAANAGSAVVLRNTLSPFVGNIIVNGIASATPFAGSGLAVGGCLGCLISANITVNGTLEMGTQGMGWANVSGSQFAMNGLSGSGVVVGNFGAAAGAFIMYIGSSTGSGSFSGVIAAGANRQLNLVKQGLGTQILTGNNTYTGTTVAGAGTLQVGNGGTTGTLGGGAVNDAGNLVFNRSDAYAIPNSISGSGNLTATSGSDLAINGGVNVSGTVTLTAGAGQPVAAPGVANGSVTGGDVTLNAAVTAGGAGKLIIYSGNATTAAYEAQIAGSATSLNKAYATAPGAGTVDSSKTLNVFYRVSPTATANFIANDKVYDATTAATVNAAATNVTGGIDGDALSGSVTSASFADANAGNGKTVSFGGASVASTVAGQTVSGYQVIAPTATANITPAPLTLTAQTDSKTYDATTSATAAPTVSGLQGTDSVSGLAESYADKNAGTGKTLQVSGYIVNDGNGGGNYTVSTVNDTTGTITPAALTLTASINSKTYDGTTGAAAVPTVSGLQGSDSVTGLGEAYADKNAGSGKTLAVNSYTVNDGNGGGNYTVSTVADSTGTITPAALIVTANNDAKFVTQADAAGYAGVSYTGFVNGETPAVLGGSASIVRSNAGTQGAGAYGGVLQAGGLTSGNYTISYAAGDYTIVPANELLVRLGNNNATYGSSASYGAPTAQYMLSDGSIVTLAPTLAGNQVTVNDGAGGGVNFTVQVDNPSTSTSGNLRTGGYQLGAAGVSGNSTNFSNNLVVTGALNVDPLAVSVAPGGVVKTYDATAAMSGLTLGLTGALAGDVVTASGSGSFSSRNAGTGLAYTVSNLALAGPDGSNYVLSGGSSSYSGNNGTITPAALTLTAAANSKTYDTTTSAAALPTVTGLQGSDSVSGLGEAYADRNAGTGKTLVVGNGYTVNDGNGGGNYTVSLVDANVGTITPAALTLMATSNSKTYDATTGATALPTVSGLLGSDSVNGLAEAYADKNAGTGKTLVVSGYAVNDGNGGGNYAVSLVNDDTGSITPRAVTVAAPDFVSKTYDGSTSVPAGYAPVVVSGGVGEGVLSGTLAYATPDVGIGKTVNVSGVTMDDGNGGRNYVVTLQPNATGIVLSKVAILSTLERLRPDEPLALAIWAESCADGCAIQLSDIRAQLPEICDITGVAGEGMAALPPDITYDPASGQLRFAARARAPQAITARALDCRGKPRDVRIRLSTTAAVVATQSAIPATHP